MVLFSFETNPKFCTYFIRFFQNFAMFFEDWVFFNLQITYIYYMYYIKRVLCRSPEDSDLEPHIQLSKLKSLMVRKLLMVMKNAFGVFTFITPPVPKGLLWAFFPFGSTFCN